MRLDSRQEHFRQVPGAGEGEFLEERNRSAPAHHPRYYSRRDSATSEIDMPPYVR